jgi:2'-5' RNA ligase
MPYAITLMLDAVSAPSVVAPWETLAAHGISESAIRSGYPPHLTLAVFSDGADAERLIGAARETSARWRKLPIRLTSLGVFPGPPAVMFLAPVVTQALLTAQAELLIELDNEPVDPHYRSGGWVPHVTLADDLTDPAAALAVLQPLRLPIDAMLDTIEVVRFRPVEVLASHALLTDPSSPG